MAMSKAGEMKLNFTIQRPWSLSLEVWLGSIARGKCGKECNSQIDDEGASQTLAWRVANGERHEW